MTIKLITCLVVCWLFLTEFQVNGSGACVPKTFEDAESVVCVCNGTYCDTFPTVDNVQNGAYVIYTSSKDGKRFDQVKKTFLKSFDKQPDIAINASKTYQSIIGFGGAMTDAAALNIFRLPPDTRQKLLESYYSPSGLEYTLTRIPIASTDFSTRTYSYHDIEDIRLGSFNLTIEDFNYKIPAAKMAMKMSKRKIKFFSSSWSAPKWMKTNNDYIGRGFLKGSPGGDYYKAWANYLIKFLDAYKKNGVEMWGMTVQNEPFDGRVPYFPFQCMGFDSQSERDFIAKDLGPALHAAGYQNLSLMAYDDSIYFLPGFAETLYSNEDSAKYVSGIGIHWYYSGYFAYSRLSETHKVNPNKFILATEACTGSAPYDTHVVLGSWERAEQYADDIIKDLQNWVTGWTDWNIALNMSGGPNWVNNNVDSPIIVNKGEFYKQPMYYALGHFSKFLVPDSVRIDMEIKDEYIDGVAFSTPEKLLVVVLMNKSDYDRSVVIKADGNMLEVGMKSHSISTVVWRK